jgi:hypothetical protein
MAFLVLGLMPLRALRWATLNEPNPTRETFSPFLRAAMTALMKPLRASPAFFWEISAATAIFLINSSLLILPPRNSFGYSGYKFTT